MILDKHYWWTADRTRVVPDGDPEAAFLAFAKGHEVADTLARSYGMLRDDQPEEAAAADGDTSGKVDGSTGEGDDADDEKAGEKADEKAKAAPANKARTKAPDKSGE
jgi:hypothetical protein